MPSVDTGHRVCIALHDVAPATWPACQRLLASLDDLGSPPVTLLVVPDYHHHGRIDHHTEFVRALDRRLARGDELALHGYHHVDDQPIKGGDRLRRRLYTAGEGEFAALTAEAAVERLDAGLRLTRRLGWEVHGFVAPAWLISDGARQALDAAALDYTTTLNTFISLRSGQVLAAPTLVYSVRSAWRRAASRLWNHRLLQHARHNPVLRIGLHPTDANHVQVLEDWRRLIAAALAHRQPVTKRAIAETIA